MTKVNPGSQACPPIIPQFVLTAQTLALAAVVGIAVLVVLRQFGRLAARDQFDSPDGNPDGAALVPLVVTAGAAILLTIAVRLFVPDVPLISLDRIPVEPVAIILALPAVAFASVLVVIGHTATFLVAARTTGVDAPVSRLLPLALLAMLAMVLPNIGGWGPREGVTAWAFAADCVAAAVCSEPASTCTWTTS